MDNSVVFTGQVCRQVEHSESPAGILHSYLVLEQRSVQQEAGMNRQTYVRLQVVCAGQQFSSVTHNLTVGMTVRVFGFLNRHQNRSGQSKLVLHAQQIEILS